MPLIYAYDDIIFAFIVIIFAFTVIQIASHHPPILRSSLNADILEHRKRFSAVDNWANKKYIPSPCSKFLIIFIKNPSIWWILVEGWVQSVKTIRPSYLFLWSVILKGLAMYFLFQSTFFFLCGTYRAQWDLSDFYEDS